MAQAQLIYLGTLEGVVILSNPGHTDRWITVGRELTDQSILACVCDPEAPMQARVATAGPQYATTDSGQLWSLIEEAAPLPEPWLAYTFPGQPPAQIEITGDPLVLKRSDDQGASWTPVALEIEGAPSVLHAPAYHPDTAYLGTSRGELWQSTDRGRTWSRVKRDLPSIQAIAIGRVR